MEKCRIGLLLPGWQTDPRLNPMDAVTLPACFFKALGMGDAVSRDHPVDFSRTNGLLGIKAVPVHDFARKQIGDGREADVRVRADIHVARDARREVNWTHVVEEHEGTGHPLLRGRQDAADGKASEVSRPLRDDVL